MLARYDANPNEHGFRASVKITDMRAVVEALEDAQEALRDIWDALAVQKGSHKTPSGEYITGARSFSVSLVKRISAVLDAADKTVE